MAEFEAGRTIPTLEGKPVKIVKYLAEGGQGIVYLVEFDGKQRALKWYKQGSIKKPEAFYENLKKNVHAGSPDPAFLWPLAVTEQVDGSFGYVMELRPDGYYELVDYILAKVTFTSFKAAVEACIRIVSAFRILHNEGKCYQDMNSGNFFIHPKTGDVLICDNDNVSPNNMDTFILGTPQYMAPEVVLSQSKPNTQTDRFSLAVVLFMILCMNHPLEGEHWMVPCLTSENERALYGSKALFIYDRDDASNRPVKSVHANVIARWSYMPDYIKEAFWQAFSQEAIHNPAKRLRELDWLKVLVRFQGDIVRCPACKTNEVFIQNASDTKCDCCGKVLKVAHTLKLSDYALTAARSTRIYRCQLGSCNANEALDRIGVVVANRNNPSQLGFQNATNRIWTATTPSGKTRQVQPKEVIPLKAGISLEVEQNKVIEIK